MELTAANEWVRVLGGSTESFAELGLGFWQLTGANANFSELGLEGGGIFFLVIKSVPQLQKSWTYQGLYPGIEGAAPNHQHTKVYTLAHTICMVCRWSHA